MTAAPELVGASEDNASTGAVEVAVPVAEPPAWVDSVAALAGRVRWQLTPRLWWLVLGWRLAVLMIRGGWRVARWWWGWITVADLTKAMSEASSDTLAVFLARGRTRWFRFGLTVGVVVPLTLSFAIAVLVAAVTVAAWIAGPTAAVAAVAAGVAGRDKTKPVMPKRRGTIAITGDAIIDAHRAAGILKAGENLEFRVPPTKEPDGPVAAMRMLYDLPQGRTFDEAEKRIRHLGSALRRPVAAIDMHMGEHEGQVDLWVAEMSPYKVPVPAWPWIDRDEVDLFTEPIPQGIDLRGQPVRLPLLWTAALISARPRRGKSYELRKLLLSAGLDPYTRAIIINPKQSGDYRPLRAFAHRYVEREAARTLAILREVEADMWRAYDVLADLPPEVCPESKITRAIHRDPALNARLTVIGCDEIQIPFEDEEHGDEIKEVMTNLAKVGPAVGIVVLAATQRPDGTVVPIGWRSVIGTRIALQVMTEGDSKIALGAHHTDRYDASRLPATQGVSIVAGDVEAHASAPDGPRVTRLHEVSTLASQAISERARARRVELGLLEGDAAGDTEIRGLASTGAATVLEKALAVVGDEDRITSAELAATLGTDPTALAKELAKWQVGPTDIRTPSGSKKGYYAADLKAAYDGR